MFYTIFDSRNLAPFGRIGGGGGEIFGFNFKFGRDQTMSFFVLQSPAEVRLTASVRVVHRIDGVHLQYVR